MTARAPHEEENDTSQHHDASKFESSITDLRLTVFRSRSGNATATKGAAGPDKCVTYNMGTLRVPHQHDLGVGTRRSVRRDHLGHGLCSSRLR